MKPWVPIVLCLLAPPAYGAPLDMSTQTCQDWLDASEDEQEQMAAWLRGYVAGRGSGAVFDLARVRADSMSLRRYCQSHASIGLVSAAGQLLR